MKKKLISTCILVNLLATDFTFATVVDTLIQRLNKNNSFYATFFQKVISKEGGLIYKSQGEFWLKRPNLFNWHTVTPEETFLISDSNVLWFYSPLTNQVTVNWLNNSVKNTPFILLTNGKIEIFQNYIVRQNGDTFTLLSTIPNCNTKKFMITITHGGVVKNFTIVDQGDRHNIYILKEQKNTYLNDNIFKFVLPKGVSLDDQR